MKRQQKRKMLLIISMILFPVTIYYFSPALIISAGLEGVINGSFIVFVTMTVCSVFFGRWFCAWLCPAGGLQEIMFLANSKSPKQGWKNTIKYIIWTVWIAAVVFSYMVSGEIVEVDFFYMTDHGISVADIYGYIIYYGIVLLIVVSSLVGGKRAFCHYFCWMAPFMVIGTKLRRALRLPGLHIACDSEKCRECACCNKACPMGVDIAAGAKRGKCQSEDCIQCGECVDACPNNALKYSMKRGV